jgi:hypothetical protein
MKLKKSGIIILVIALIFEIIFPICAKSSDDSVENSKNQFSETKPNIHFSDKSKQRELITLLNKEGIPYTVEILRNSNKEHVIWDKKYDSRVQKMIWDIQEEIPNISFPSKKQNEHFISLMKREKIYFRIVNRNTNSGSKETIEYRAEDASRVRELIIEVLRKSGT